MLRAITAWPKWCFSKDEQQDVFQNIYVQLQKALPNFRQQSSLSWFIKQIAIRQCINEIRRQVRWRGVLVSTVQKNPNGEWQEMDFESPGTPTPRQEIIQKERWQILRTALERLKETCKESITLFYVHELSYQEISKQLGISVNTVGSRLSKCLDKLQKELRQQPLFERNQP